MFWMSCFYVMIALVSLVVVSKYTMPKMQRRLYTRTELLASNTQTEKPTDWKPITTFSQETKENITKQETLESFILKEVENSVKELEKKRVPFAKIDSNVIVKNLNPAVTEFVPKARLNPLAQDFHPLY